MPMCSTLTVHKLFERQAETAPDSIAVLCGDVAISYSELNARANRLARHLLGLGVAPGERVAVCLVRSPELIVSLLGILKAGGAYVPLDPTYPDERLQFIVQD